ncbi:MAG: hypothetical protein LE178_06540, partial [Endomicrobium sp.]|nr:hypothetical protein [Endomicrobium sp.]
AILPLALGAYRLKHSPLFTGLPGLKYFYSKSELAAGWKSKTSEVIMPYAPNLIIMASFSIWNAMRSLVFAGNGPEVSVGDVMRESSSHNALELGSIGLAEIGLMQIDREFNRKNGIWSWTKGKWSAKKEESEGESEEEIKETDYRYNFIKSLKAAKKKTEDLVDIVASEATNQMAMREDVTRNNSKIIDDALKAAKDDLLKREKAETEEEVNRLTNLAREERRKVIDKKRGLRVEEMTIPELPDWVKSSDALYQQSMYMPAEMQQAVEAQAVAIKEAAVEKVRLSDIGEPDLGVTVEEAETLAREVLKPHVVTLVATLKVVAISMLSNMKTTMATALKEAAVAQQ